MSTTEDATPGHAPAPHPRDEVLLRAGAELVHALDSIRHRHGLTAAEVLALLMNESSALLAWAIRKERET